LAGSFATLGFSVEWHDFETGPDLDWGRSFHPDGIEICLNLQGAARLATNGLAIDFPPSSQVYYYPAEPPLRAARLAGQRHEFLTVELARPFLARHLAGRGPGLDAGVRHILNGGAGRSHVAPVRPLTTEQRHFVASLRHPPVAEAAQPVWYLAKVLELCAQVFFRPAEDFFCERQKRAARERVERAVALLRAHLADPPDLEALGRQVGCSPFYLSRTFSREMGMSIPQYLRQLRMERAAALLRTGRYNVTEAAMEVGYSSLSHFSLAFCQTIGCCPNLYPQAALGGGARRTGPPASGDAPGA
jgi:AraC-like DNA-binding protein